MKRLIIVSLALVMFGISGCAYMNVKAPLDEDLNQTTMGTRTGEASAQSVLWLVAWGDASTRAAATNGNISVINHMDVQVQSYVFGLYSKKTVIVYGD
ncbi:MAG: hypothetical protein GY737_04265 [Desulfobacteraceae bacterium]|nr:hypothetical protein [Desulfobacteraceae bacterium]